MTARDDILGSIRRNLPQLSSLPENEGNWIKYEDPQQQFAEVLASVGGQCRVVASAEEIGELLGEQAEEGKIVFSRVPGLLNDRFDSTGITDPHHMQHVDLTILPGDLYVAENAAVWVQTIDVLERAACFLGQHLALVVPLKNLMHNMHEAYRQIQIDKAPFGCFISGPSKTADIEQSLVKGAHGARTLQVFLVADA